VTSVLAVHKCAKRRYRHIEDDITHTRTATYSAVDHYNRTLHTRFRLVPKSMTLDDALFQITCAF